MNIISREKLFSKQWFWDYSLIIVGTFIMASGYVFFIDPHKIVPGGVYGIAIVVNDLTQGLFPNGIFGLFVDTFHQYNDGLPIGIVSWVINIPLLILGVKILGPRFGFKTIVGFSACSYFIDFLTSIWGLKPLTGNDILLSCIFGGILIGLGLALIFKAKGTTAGSDIIAMILEKYTKLSLGQLIIYIDAMIVLVALIAFKDWKIPLYSWIVIYVTGKVIDMAMQGADHYKALLIISEKHEEIRNKLINELERTGTYLNGEGLYNGQDKKVIYTVVNRRELVILQSFIQEIDEKAFVTVLDSHEILGNGFKPLIEN